MMAHAQGSGPNTKTMFGAMILWQKGQLEEKRLGYSLSSMNTPGSPWENGYIESFNGKLKDELLDREIFTTLIEAKILIEEWRKEYNQVRPYSALNYRPPAPETIGVDSNLSSGTINGGRSLFYS